MKFKLVSQWELRRSAIVAGRAEVASAEPLVADRLSLQSSGGKRRHRYRSHVRRGGVFFFLDAAPGKYELVRSDAAGNVIQKQEVAVPARTAGARLPLVRVDLPVPDSSPGRPRGKARPT